MRIAGRWRITEAELWDCDALNLVAPAFIEFAEDGSGSFGFIAVQGEMDCREVERDGRPGVEFSWEGNDECDPASGRRPLLSIPYLAVGGTVSQLRVRRICVTRGLLAGRLVVEAGVARTHLAITVELVHGAHTGDLWPRPGRVLIAARTATFEQLGKAIDDAFARWDHNHLHEFTLADGTVIIPVRWWDGEEPEGSLDGAKARLGRLRPGEQFAYTFDLGDNWQHLCTVAPQRADPLETLGIIPAGPLPCWGWGDTPDQYGRRWDGDDGSSPVPKAPDGLADLRRSCPGGDPGDTASRVTR